MTATAYTIAAGNQRAEARTQDATALRDLRRYADELASERASITDLDQQVTKQRQWLDAHRDDPLSEQRETIWQARWDELDAKRDRYLRTIAIALGLISRLTPDQAASSAALCIRIDQCIRWSWTWADNRPGRNDSPDGEPCPF